MAGKTANAFVKINVIVSSKKAAADLTGMAAGLRRWGDGFRRAGMIATAAMAAVSVAVYAAVKAVMKFVNAYLEWGKQNLAITRLTGITGKAVAQLSTQFRMSGVDATKAQTGLALFAKKLDAARTAGGAALAPFQRLGVALKDNDGKLRSTGDVLADVRDKLSTVKDAATRAGIAGTLFGKGFKEMLPWLMKSRKEITGYNKILAESGVQWGGKQVKGMKAYIAAQREMQLRWDLFKVYLGQQLMPTVTKVFKAMNKWLSNADNIKKVRSALQSVGNVVSGLVNWFLKLSSGWQKFVIGVAAAGAVSGPIMLSLSSILNVASSIAKILPGLGAAAASAGSRVGAAGAAGAAASGGGLAAAAGSVIPVAVVAMAGAVIYGIAKATQAEAKGTTPRQQGNTFGRSELDVSTTKANASMALLQKRWNALKEQLQLRIMAGEFDNKDILAKIRAVEVKMAALRNRVKLPFATGHVKSEKWMSDVEKAQIKLNHFRAAAKLPIMAGHLNTSGITGPIADARRQYELMKLYIENTPISSHVTIHQTTVKDPPPKAWGGIVSSPQVALIGEAGPEAIIPLTKPARAAEVMRQAGLTGTGSGFTVNVVLPSGTTLVGEAARVGEILAPHVARALGRETARAGRRR